MGNFHEFARLGLTLYLSQAVVVGSGMAYVVTVHGLQLLWYVGFGFLILATGQVSFRRMVRATRSQVTGSDEKKDDSRDDAPGG